MQGQRSYSSHTLQWQLRTDHGLGHDQIKWSVELWQFCHRMPCPSTLTDSSWIACSSDAPCPFRYLYFYKHTVDLLREHGIVSAEEVPLPVVSTAISHLWQELSEERRDSILQYCSQRDFHLGPTDACQEPACADGGVRDSGGNSEEASGSLVSTPEEVSAQ